jgi:hypothetical protein
MDAKLDERDLGSIKVGQAVSVRAGHIPRSRVRRERLVSGRFLPSGHWSLYENGSFGEKSELALLAARRPPFFLSFFNFLVGFFATFDFLVFLESVRRL